MPNTFEGFVPFVIFLVMLAGLGAAMITLSSVLGPKGGGRTKYEPWEAGMPPIQTNARERFAVPFYLVAILFILFDLETVFLFPWAVVVKSFAGPEAAAFRLQLLCEVFAFIAVLGVGLVYVWKRRGLEWD